MKFSKHSHYATALGIAIVLSMFVVRVFPLAIDSLVSGLLGLFEIVIIISWIVFAFTKNSKKTS